MFFWPVGSGFMLMEFFTFILVIGKIGFFKTFLLCLLSAFVGGFLIQAQGMAVLAKAQNSFARKAFPVSDLYESLCLFIAGLLFILPGFLSDIMALVLLMPMGRHLLRKASGRLFGLKEEVPDPIDGDIIEGQYEHMVEISDILEKPSQDR